MTPTYKSWAGMKQRCNNPQNSDYSNYGGRGITYDSRWEVYENFRTDMGRKPEGKTLNRLDNNKNYCKENCNWATSQEQNNNRRDRIRGYDRTDNTSGVAGVFHDKRRGTWYARIYRDGSPVNLIAGVSYERAVEVRLQHQEKQNSNR